MPMSVKSRSCRQSFRAPTVKPLIYVTSGFRYLRICRKNTTGNWKNSRRQTGNWKKRALKAERQRDEALDKITVLRRRLYETASELEDEKGRNLKLRAQINRDYENSSMPSSKTIKKKKISNSREKSGRKPGSVSMPRFHQG